MSPLFAKLYSVKLKSIHRRISMDWHLKKIDTRTGYPELLNSYHLGKWQVGEFLQGDDRASITQVRSPCFVTANDNSFTVPRNSVSSGNCQFGVYIRQLRVVYLLRESPVMLEDKRVLRQRVDFNLFLKELNPLPGVGTRDIGGWRRRTVGLRSAQDTP